MPTYSNGTYRLEVGRDGSIVVKSGDWLSKYSAAIYNNFTTLEVFYRPPDASGNLTRIVNKDLIHAGETLFHKPDWDKWKQRKPGNGGDPAAPDGMTKQELLRKLHDELDIPGEKLRNLNFLLTGANWSRLGEKDAYGQLFGVIMGAAGLAGPFFMGTPGPGFLHLVVQSLFAMLDAQEAALRYAGLRAIAYSTTAFAFNDPVPVLPYGIEYSITHGTWRGTFPLEVHKQEWMKVANQTRQKLMAEVAKWKVDVQVYQIWVQWGSTNRRSHARMGMDEMAKHLTSPAEKRLLMQPEPIYPNDWADDRPVGIY